MADTLVALSEFVVICVWCAMAAVVGVALVVTVWRAVRAMVKP